MRKEELKALSKLELYKIIRGLKAELIRTRKERDGYAQRVQEDRAHFERVLRTLLPGRQQMYEGTNGGSVL